MTKPKDPTQLEETAKLPEDWTPIEAELAKPGRRRHKHPSHTETHPLDAQKERGRNIQRGKKGIKSKAKKYDGRAFSKNAVVARAAVREALESFYKEVKLPELKMALEVSNDPRYNMLLAAINNPRLHSCSFSELCRKCRMSIQDVVEVWRNHMKTQGIVRIMGHMPDIMEDVAIDSRSRIVICDQCQGEGKLIGQTTNRIQDPICPACHGDGKLRLGGDKDARLLAFETVGLKKGSVGQVNVLNVNKNVPSIEDQIANIDQIFEADYQEVNDEPANNATVGDASGTQRITEQSPSTGESPRNEYSSVKPEDDSYTKPDPTDYSS